MTRKKIVHGIGTLFLAATALFASKTGSKYSIAQGLYVSTINGSCLTIKTSPVTFFSTLGTVQAAIKTSEAGGLRCLWATNTCGFALFFKRVYFKK